MYKTTYLLFIFINMAFGFVTNTNIQKVVLSQRNYQNSVPTMFLKSLNFRKTVIALNKDIYSFVIEEKGLTERKSILNFPGFFNVTHNIEHDFTFVSSICPCNKHENKKKNILYLPGIDFTAISFYPYYLSLKSEYNIHTAVAGLNSKITFTEICKLIEDYMDRYINNDVIIIGESFGALPAIYITNKLEKKLFNKLDNRLILINPATSYLKSNWPAKIKDITITEQDKLSTNVVMDVISHGPSLVNIFKNIQYLKNRFPEESKYHTYIYFYILINILNISPEHLEYRIEKWIEEGIKVVNTDYEKIKSKTLLLGGANDDFLPSKEEVKFLEKKIKNSKAIVINNAAHAISLSNCDLNKLIKKYL